MQYEVVGHVDRATSEEIRGWIAVTQDGLRLEGNRRIKLIVDDDAKASTLAGLERRDLASVYRGDTNCGFTFSLTSQDLQGLGGRAFSIVDQATGLPLTIENATLPSSEIYYLDIGDTLVYLQHHGTVSGIQRVVVSISLALYETSQSSRNVQLVAGRTDGRGFAPIDWNEWLDVVKNLEWDSGSVRRAATLLHERSHSAEPWFPSPSLGVVLTLGSPWVSERYIESLAQFRALGGRLIALVYDMIPVRMPESFDSGTTRRLARVMATYARACSLVLAISEFSRQDFLTFCQEQSLPQPSTHTLALTAGRGSRQVISAQSRTRIDEPYVLIVSTIEGRKGHRTALAAWERMLERLGPEDTPQLVLVGRPGWKSTDVLDKLATTNYLGGKVTHLTEVSDAELDALYAEALFTIYPSTYEGWGLPVSESLAHGTPVIAARSTSIPEAGGDFAAYFSPQDHEELYKIASSWALDDDELATWRRRVEEYEPKGWEAVAHELWETCQSTLRNLTAAHAIEMPVRKEVMLSPNTQDFVSDDWIGAIWADEFANASPLLGVRVRPVDESLGPLLVTRGYRRAAHGGMHLALGESVEIAFTTQLPSSQLYFHAEVQEGFGSLLLQVRGDAEPANAWLGGSMVLRVHALARGDGSCKIRLTAFPGPLTNDSCDGLVIKSLVAEPEDERTVLLQILSRRLGVTPSTQSQSWSKQQAAREWAEP